MHRTKSHLSPLILAAIAASSLSACSESPTKMSLVEEDALLCSVAADVNSRGQAEFVAPGGAGYALSGTLSRETTDNLPQPVDLTLLRYGPRGSDMVVTDYLNLALGEEDSFRVEDLPAGLWVVSARSATASSASWGRSEPMILGPDSAASEEPQVQIELRSYGADLEVVGIPPALVREARLTFEWASTDRVQGEALEFLDPPRRAEYPGQSGSLSDGFQVFGALVHVPEVWLAFDQGASPPVGPEGEPMLDTQIDPFGMGESLQTWISLCSKGHAAVAMGGPGYLTATLHGVPGLWETQTVTFDLTADEPFGHRVLDVEPSQRSSDADSDPALRFVDATLCK